LKHHRRVQQIWNCGCTQGELKLLVVVDGTSWDRYFGLTDGQQRRLDEANTHFRKTAWESESISLAHPASAAVIPGASKPERIVEDHSAINEKVPDDFWLTLREEALVSPMAPLPIDHKIARIKGVADNDADHINPEDFYSEG